MNGIYKVVTGLAIAFFIYQSDFLQNNSEPDFKVADDVEIVLLATQWCGYCKKARNLMNQHQIPYTEYDIEKSNLGRTYYNDVGKGGIPVLIINDKIVRGYQPKKILQLSSSGH